MTDDRSTDTKLIRTLPNLASPAQGGAICAVSDDFFGAAKRMLSDAAPVFDPDRYDQHGKWMDGWESRRKRTPGHDYCVIRIRSGVIRAFEVDTSHFTGNFPPATSIDVCHAALEPDENTDWTVLLPRSELEGDSRRLFLVDNDNSWNHVRINIYPDGGIARLKVYGEPDRHTHAFAGANWVDLASADNGGHALACNNMHFGHMDKLLAAGPPANMGDGWETRRRRKPGNDWVVLQLGQAGRIERVEVDTAFFKGNYPARCSLKAAFVDAAEDVVKGSEFWPELLPPVPLGPDQLNVFEDQLNTLDAVSHARLDIYPDGGVARLRLLGVPAGGQSG